MMLEYAVEEQATNSLDCDKFEKSLLNIAKEVLISLLIMMKSVSYANILTDC